MALDLCFSQGRHSSNVRKIFGEDLDAFLREDVLTGLFGSRWESVLGVDGDQAMLHALVPSLIGTTGWHDVEPFFGYAGPVFKQPTPQFVQAALDAYRAACRRRGIVAELIRFQPDLRNHLSFSDVDGIVLHEARLIAYIPIVDGGDDDQMAVYTPPCRRQIRSARARLHFERLDRSPQDWRQFVELYGESLSRNNAARRWYFDGAFFERMRGTGPASLWGVFADSGRRELLSATLVVAAKDIVHTLFVANAPPHRLAGAHDLLTHGVVRAHRDMGYRWVCLGGGRSNAAKDPLLAFKRKFAAGNLLPLPMGFVVHDQPAFEALCDRAAGERRSGEGLQQSTELLAQWMPYRLAPCFADPGAAPKAEAMRDRRSEMEAHGSPLR
jgi:Acetyltransferase (GNAT) domain